ncbi:MAG: DUF1343 domain-containing protein [Eudoraea sp.]|nr:DUF1343 domain-containing protein [Eudoraea sp.]
MFILYLQKYSFHLVNLHVSLSRSIHNRLLTKKDFFLSAIVFLGLFFLSSCGTPVKKNTETFAEGSVLSTPTIAKPIVVGANQTTAYLPLLATKNIAVVANQTSVIFNNDPKAKSLDNSYTHLVDSLLSLGVSLKKVFAPEHGFRGIADAGEKVKDGIDIQSGLPIISLYGANRKPTNEQLQGLDVVVFDIQDVGVRFYTYIATLQLVMEACASNNIPVVVLDRPNPNGHYIDGPTMEPALTGFLGMTTIPLVYGMTIGEYATMINEEGWLAGNRKVDLTIIPLENYTHLSSYELPVRPSPNLPNAQAINLYPSLGLFEGTTINAGRGTEFQFQRYGAPFLDETSFAFSYTPAPNFGSKDPKHNNAICYGEDLSTNPHLSEVSLQWIIKAYEGSKDKEGFFKTAGFSKHAGTEVLQKQLVEGMSETAIKKTWQKDLLTFKKIREKYLLYP